MSSKRITAVILFILILGAVVAADRVMYNRFQNKIRALKTELSFYEGSLKACQKEIVPTDTCVEYFGQSGCDYMRKLINLNK